jgi:hypothetical protein
VRIATFRCNAAARCGAFVDEGRVVAGDQGGRTKHGRRQAGSRFWVIGFGVTLQSVE